jgi:hypothetical protein
MSKKLLNIQKKRDYKLVGASLPSWVFTYLSIYAVAKKITKTGVIKPLIEDWVTKIQNKETDIILIEEIVDQIKFQWENEKKSNPELKFAVFKETIKQELQIKGIINPYVSLIIKKLSNGAK